MDITRALTFEGRGKVTLTQANYVTTGGEASLYRTADLMAKIYTDPDKMIRDRMADKIAILSKIKHRFLVTPINLVLGEKTNPVGYYMPFAGNTEAMSRVFTTAFRQRTGFADIDAICLVHNMREAVIAAHSHDCILVDANELNWLELKAAEAEPRLVDIDSCQIGQRWPATVIMPSIKDHHTKGFNEKSDWFSWAVVSFQVFTGIHPYKGRLDPYSMSEMEERMRVNASVFSPGIRLNAAVRDFSCIPSGLLSWYEGVFQSGERSVPPSPRDTKTVATAARLIRQTISASGSLVFEKLMDAGTDPFVRIYPSGLALRASGKLVDLQSKMTLPIVAPVVEDLEVIKTQSGWLVAAPGFYHHVTLATDTVLSLPSNVKTLVRQYNRLFAVTDRGIAEIKLIELGKTLLTLGRTWQVLPLATEWYQGVGVQNALGAKFFVLPWDENNLSFIRCRELDDVTIVSAKAGKRFVAVVVLTKQGDYQKLEFTFDANHSSYTLWTGVTDTPDLNLAILQNGVCATIVRDGELAIFVPVNGKVNKVSDKTIATDMQLATWGDKVVYLQGGDIWWVSLK